MAECGGCREALFTALGVPKRHAAPAAEVEKPLWVGSFCSKGKGTPDPAEDALQHNPALLLKKFHAGDASLHHRPGFAEAAERESLTAKHQHPVSEREPDQTVTVFQNAAAAVHHGFPIIQKLHTGGWDKLAGLFPECFPGAVQLFAENHRYHPQKGYAAPPVRQNA